MHFDDVKTTIKEHPVETVAVVAVVGLTGAYFYQRNQKKQLELELAKYRAMRPPWWSYFLRRRHQEPEPLKLVA